MWLNIEKILKEYTDEDQELRQKFRELKFSVIHERRISNYVYSCEKMKKECKKLKGEIDRLRNLLTTPHLGQVDERVVFNAVVQASATDTMLDCSMELSPRLQMVPVIKGDRLIFERVSGPEGVNCVSTVGLPDYT